MSDAPATNSPAHAVISLRGVGMGYGTKVILSRVSFDVHAGDFWFLLGPNGAGKSTLLRTILGGLPPLEGELRKDEEFGQPRNIGFVPQRCDLNPSLPTTVREFVSLGLVGVPHAASARRERLSWALERCNLGHMEDKDYWSLSGGQRQRALLARALIRRPALFIVDEPTTGLDPSSQELLMDSLAALNEKERLTVLFVTHDLPLAARYASHVALFVGGTVRAGTRDDVLRPDLLQEAYGLPIEMHTEAQRHPTPGAKP